MLTTYHGTQVRADGTQPRRDFSLELEQSDGSRDPEERNQIVKAEGNRVLATPYQVVFNDGFELVSDKPAELVVTEEYNGYKNEGTASVPIHSSVVFRPHNMDAPKPDPQQVGLATTTAMARARQGMVSLPILAHEAGATVNMIKNRVTSMQDAAIALQKRALRDYYRQKSRNGRKKVYDHYAGLHLEYLFGWATTAEELVNLKDAMQKPKQSYIVGRGKSKKNVTFNGPPITDSSMRRYDAWSEEGHRQRFYVTGRSDRVDSYTEMHRAKASVTYDVTFEWQASQAKYGLSSGDALFDAVPMSFLLNFSSNTQEYLAALTPLIGATFRTGNVTTYNTMDLKSKAYGTFQMRLATTKLSAAMLAEAEWKGRTTEVIRQPFMVEPSPEWFLVNKMSLAKVVTSAMLAIQQRNLVLSRLIKKKAFATPPRRNKRPSVRDLPPINYNP